jgi:hypothetical protein
MKKLEYTGKNKNTKKLVKLYNKAVDNNDDLSIKILLTRILNEVKNE